MDLDAITPVILTLNEAPNIGRTLEQLTWAREIVILDSGSSDRTLTITGEFANVRVESRPFDTHASQRNNAIARAATDWVLSLDADYLTGPELAAELDALEPDPEQVAYYANFRYLVFGKPLRRSILPPRPVLFDRRRCHYVADGHSEQLEIAGASGRLRSRIDHDDRKSLSRWLHAQDGYARLEARKLTTTPIVQLSRADRIRRWKWVAPWLVPLICLAKCGVVLDGWRGIYYALQRGLAESLLALRLIEGEQSASSGDDATA